MSFKDENRDMQELARELMLLRKHNLQFKARDPQDKLLLFAEGALCCLALERFLRILLGENAPEKASLKTLLQRATGKNIQILELEFDDREDAIDRICAVRNTMLHGNYEQAAADSGCASVEEYFQTKFAAEIEGLHRIADGLVAQIDAETGARRS